MRRWRFIIGGAALCLAVAACGSSGGNSGGSSGSSGSPYTITAIVAAAGPFAPINTAEMQGMKAGAAYVNAHGGILGHKVQITVQNDNLDPTTAASLLQQDLSGGQAPDLVYAGSTSNETSALVPILTTHKILSLQIASSAETIDPAKNPYAFTVGQSDTSGATDIAAALQKAFPTAKTVGLIIGNDVEGTATLALYKPALTAAGYKVDVESYDPATDINLAPQMSALKGDHPDVLLAEGFGPPAGYILKARAALGWNIPVLGDATFSSSPLTSLVPKADLAGVQVFTLSTYIYKPPSEEPQNVKTFQRLVEAQGATFSQAYLLYTLGYDVPVVAQAAAQQARSIDAAAMKTALEHLKQPASPAWVSYPNYVYSPTQHAPILSADLADTATPYTKDGMYLAAGGSS